MLLVRSADSPFPRVNQILAQGTDTPRLMVRIVVYETEGAAAVFIQVRTVGLALCVAPRGFRGILFAQKSFALSPAHRLQLFLGRSPANLFSRRNLFRRQGQLLDDW